jgi:hypothetical protein
MKLKYYLIASEANDFRPWIMTPMALACFCMVVWGLRLFVPMGITIAAPGIDATDVMNRVNAERTNRFLPALITNPKLMAAAVIKSNDMLERNYFAHVDPDGNYIWPTIEAQGYKPYKTLGENLAMDFTDAKTMVEAWMNSPGHRANILNDKFEDQGMAAIFGEFTPGHDTIEATNLFGALYKTAPTPAPTPVPQPTPPPTTSKPTPPPATVQPNSAPPTAEPPTSPTPTPPTAREATEPITIGDQISVVSKTTADKNLLDLEVSVSGTPKTVQAKFIGQEIAMNKNSAGAYAAKLVLAEPVVKGSVVTIIASDEAGQSVSKDFSLDDVPGVVSNQREIPTTGASEAELSRTLKIILAIFAGVFLIFLAIDSVIIHRARIQRLGPSSSTHTLLFLLIALVNIFTALK